MSSPDIRELAIIMSMLSTKRVLPSGWAISGFYGYLVGVANELALKHIPGVEPRNDTFAGPAGRRADQVNDSIIQMHKVYN